ncbi:MAG TPA: FHA domain-containing protein [Fibrobacteria bacterium]|nr:FHA domain-containing protein [Fibrobacteria bacterium]HOX50382.1 FHA domain-containing protein [Fibrobacteria bacterium]
METIKGSSPEAVVPPLPEATEPTGWAIGDGADWVMLPRCGLLAGRSRMCDLVLPGADVSRRHARFTWIQEQPWVVDLGSANGVLMDGDPVGRARWLDGSTLILGSTRLFLQRKQAALPSALLEAWNLLPIRPVEAIRELAGAISCTMEPDRSYALAWEDGAGWDELGPLRRTLLDAALSYLAL